MQVPESQELCRYSTGCFTMACSTGCFAMACSTGCSVLMKSMCENSWVHLLDSAGCLFSIGHGAGNLHMCHLAEKGVKSCDAFSALGPIHWCQNLVQRVCHLLFSVMPHTVLGASGE